MSHFGNQNFEWKILFFHCQTSIQLKQTKQLNGPPCITLRSIIEISINFGELQTFLICNDSKYSTI